MPEFEQVQEKAAVKPEAVSVEVAVSKEHVAADEVRGFTCNAL